jgi:hypothetical protein
MLTGTCHCRAVCIEVPRKPRILTQCNCSICRRYGVLWAYYKAGEVRVRSKRGTTERYAWGPQTQNFVRCKTCGCTLYWKKIRSQHGSNMGVNARNFDPDMIGGIRIRLLDGANTWKYLD